MGVRKDLHEGGRRRRGAVAAEARHLGRSVRGEAHRSKRRERGPMRRGVWESTSPRSPWLRAWGRGYEGCNTWEWLRLNQGQGPTSVDTPRGSPRKLTDYKNKDYTEDNRETGQE